MVNTKFTNLYKSNITDKKIEADEAQTKADVLTTVLAMNDLTEEKAVFTSTDTDDYKKAAFTIANSISTSAKAEMTSSKIVETKSAWADPKGASATDLQKWLFGDAGRKKGDTTVIETKTEKTDSTTGKKTTTYSYTWYIIGEDVMKLDEEKTKNAYYIMLSDDAKDAENAKTASEKAEAFYNALKDNKTAEKFAELAEEYAPGYSTELIEKISYESIKSSNEDLAEWLYDNRTKGDITNIVVKDDTKDPEKVTGHIIAMYEDENEETWKLTARDALANERLEAWFDEHVEKYHVVIDYEPETTAATTTKAPETTAKAPETTAEPSTEAATEAGTEAATEAGTEADAE